MSSSQAVLNSSDERSTFTTYMTFTTGSTTSQNMTTENGATTSDFNTIGHDSTTGKSMMQRDDTSISYTTAPTTYTNITDGMEHDHGFKYSEGILAAMILGIIVVSVFTIALIIYRQKQLRKMTSLNLRCDQSSPPEDRRKLTYVKGRRDKSPPPEDQEKAKPAMYEQIDDADIEITILSSSPSANLENLDSKTDSMTESNPYVDCPSNVYDKAFTSRAHVYELQTNIYA